MNELEASIQLIRQARAGVEQQCQLLETSLAQLRPQLEALQEVPGELIDTGVQKTRQVIELMTKLADGCAEQVAELEGHVEKTAEDLWSDGVDALEKLESEVDTAAVALVQALPPCETAITETETALEQYADVFEQSTGELVAELETEMKTVESTITSMLDDMEENVDEHAAAISKTSLALTHFREQLAHAVQVDVVTPVNNATQKFDASLTRLRNEAVTEPLADVQSAVQGVVNRVSSQAAECFKTFDNAVEGFCDQLAGRSDGAGSKSRLTQQLTDAVKPVFEGVVQKLPGVKQIADIVGVGL